MPTSDFTKNFTYNFKSTKSPEAIFDLLLKIDTWWSGLYAETIEGESHQLNDEFSYYAGGGAHYSKHKLIELIPAKKIVWLVTESKLAFLTDAQEWTGTKIGFDISKEDNQTKVTFTHDGLMPNIECYDRCTNAWTQYLQKLNHLLR
jgi:Activator of Hsp90 ATPase homolog 1-like protein